MTTFFLFGLLLTGQSSPPTSPPADATPTSQVASQAAIQAVAAAQQAAQAAQAAAEAAAKAAQAAALAAGVSSTPIAAPPPPPPPPPPPVVSGAAAAAAPSTAGLIDLNVIWLTGNSNALTFSANGAVSHTFEGGWILSGKANGQYGQTQAAGTTVTQVNALAAGALVRGDKLLVPETSIYLLSGADTDHVASLEFRYYGEAGAGIFWLNQKEGDFQKLLLRTDIGFRGARDDRFQYYGIAGDPTTHELLGLTFLGPRFGASFRYALNKDVVFTEDAEIMENIDDAPRTLVNSATKLSARLVKQLSFAVSFLVAYDSSPAQGKVSTDTGLTIGLEASF
jgi:Protein of unknown function, DUF481